MNKISLDIGRRCYHEAKRSQTNARSHGAANVGPTRRNELECCLPMKELVAAIVVSSILFFLCCANALSFRFTNSSAHSFRLRRREHLSQILKQISVTTTRIKARAKEQLQKASKISLRASKVGHFHKNAWVWSASQRAETPSRFESQETFMLSLLCRPPLLRPPII